MVFRFESRIFFARIAMGWSEIASLFGTTGPNKLILFDFVHRTISYAFDSLVPNSLQTVLFGCISSNIMKLFGYICRTIWICSEVQSRTRHAKPAIGCDLLYRKTQLNLKKNIKLRTFSSSTSSKLLNWWSMPPTREKYKFNRKSNSRVYTCWR